MEMQIDKDGKMELKNFSIDTPLPLLHNQKFRDMVKSYNDSQDDLIENVFSSLDKGFLLANESEKTLLGLCAEKGDLPLFVELTKHQLFIEHMQFENQSFS